MNVSDPVAAGSEDIHGSGFAAYAIKKSDGADQNGYCNLSAAAVLCRCRYTYGSDDWPDPFLAQVEKGTFRGPLRDSSPLAADFLADDFCCATSWPLAQVRKTDDRLTKRFRNPDPFFYE